MMNKIKVCCSGKSYGNAISLEKEKVFADYIILNGQTEESKDSFRRLKDGIIETGSGDSPWYTKIVLIGDNFFTSKQYDSLDYLLDSLKGVEVEYDVKLGGKYE